MNPILKAINQMKIAEIQEKNQQFLERLYPGCILESKEAFFPIATPSMMETLVVKGQSNIGKRGTFIYLGHKVVNIEYDCMRFVELKILHNGNVWYSAFSDEDLLDNCMKIVH